MANYVLVGVLTNIAGYFIYLILTYIGITPRITVSILYPIGTIMGFFANRRFTFQHDGHIGKTGIRYLIVQALGYIFTISILTIFVNKLGFPHQIIEAFAIALVAIFVFVMSRLFVFV